jgi:hypothetical protein
MTERLKLSVEILEQYPNIDIVCGRIEKAGENSYFNHVDEKYYDSIDIYTLLFFENPIVHSTVLIRSEKLRSFRYNEAFSVCEDFELWTRIVTFNNVWMLDRTICLYTDHGENISIAKRAQIKANNFRIINYNFKFKLNTKLISEDDIKKSKYFKLNIKLLLQQMLNTDISFKSKVNFPLFLQKFESFLFVWQKEILMNYLRKQKRLNGILLFFINYPLISRTFTFRYQISILKQIIYKAHRYS